MTDKYEKIDKNILKIIGEDGTLKSVRIRKDSENKKASIIREMAELDKRYQDEKARKQIELDVATDEVEAFDEK